MAPYTFTIADGDTLTEGESVTVSYTDSLGAPATATAIYQGQNGTTGEPYFTVNGQEGFLTQDTYTVGAGTAPTFTDTDFDLALYCFLPGTLISTPEGSVAVETLKIGDLVLTADGRSVPVKWMGRQTMLITFGMLEPRRPISIAAGALGPNLPARDLRVTADHALMIEGLLVQAGALVNGTTIRRMTLQELGERFTVHHIELEAHDVVLAEGVPAETFVDNVTRMRFDNYPEYEALYGLPVEAMDNLPQPRVKSARQIPAALRERIAARTALLTTPESVAA